MNMSLLSRSVYAVALIAAPILAEENLNSASGQTAGFEKAVLESIDMSAFLSHDIQLIYETKTAFATQLNYAIQIELEKVDSQENRDRIYPLLSDKISAMRPGLLFADAKYLSIKAQEVAQILLATIKIQDSLPAIDKKTHDDNIAKLTFSMERAKEIVMHQLPPFVTIEQVDEALARSFNSARSNAVAIDVPFWKLAISQESVDLALISFSLRYNEGAVLLAERIHSSAIGCRQAKEVPVEACAEMQHVIRQGLDEVIGWLFHQLAESSFDESRNALIAAHLETPELLELQAQRSAMEAAHLAASQANSDLVFQEIVRQRRAHLMAGTPDEPIYVTTQPPAISGNP